MTDIPYLLPPNAVFRTPAPDPNNPKAGDWVQQWDHAAALHTFDAVIIGAPFSRSSLSHSGAFLTPSAIRRVLLDFSTYYSDYDVNLQEMSVCDIGDIAMNILSAEQSHSHIEQAINSVADLAKFIVTLGGDHSITRPVLSALSQHFGGPLGLVQFDAHHDVRTLENGPNNGTPIRGAIERGALRGEYIAQIGIHGCSNSKIYNDWARSQGIGVYTMSEVRRKGIMECAGQAYRQAAQSPHGVYVTVDMDVLERAAAPGCPASSPGGLSPWEMFDALFWLGQQPNIIGIDVVEVDPQKDVADMTVKATCLALLSFFAGKVAAKQ